MENVEIEIQVKVENGQPLLEFLGKEGDFKGEKHQIDEYFSPAHRSFIEVRPIREWLRLRDSGGRFSLNYKNWHYDENGKSDFCDEYETEIGDSNQLKKILGTLNFKSIVQVDKLRKIWTYKDYEVSVDSVKGLGDFVEIEYVGENKEVAPKEVTKKMVEFLKELGCGKVKRNYVGYPFQLLFPDEVKFEEI